jgi:hypothetical protein
MTMQLLEELKTLAADTSAKMLAEYGAILRRGAEHKGDAKRLDAIRKAMGLSLANIEVDMAILKQIADAERAIVPAMELAKLQADWNEKNAAMHAADEAVPRTEMEFAAAEQKLSTARRNISDSRRVIAELKMKTPRLFPVGLAEPTAAK